MKLNPLLKAARDQCAFSRAIIPVFEVLMKIALIEPAASEANVYSKLHMPLLGPLYLGAILKNKGHEVEIYHEEIYTPDYSKLEVDLVGIYPDFNR